MTSHHFVALFVPLFPVARYRVILAHGHSHRFLGQETLQTMDKVHMTLFGCAVCLSSRTPA